MHFNINIDHPAARNIPPFCCNDNLPKVSRIGLRKSLLSNQTKRRKSLQFGGQKITARLQPMFERLKNSLSATMHKSIFNAARHHTLIISNIWQRQHAVTLSSCSRFSSIVVILASFGTVIEMCPSLRVDVDHNRGVSSAPHSYAELSLKCIIEFSAKQSKRLLTYSRGAHIHENK